MDMKRRKQILEDYKNRHPEMGVISFSCKVTGESFFGISKETKADINSNRFKLSTGTHPNKRMQELWNKYSESGFELSVVKILKYEDPNKDHTKELNELCEQYLMADPQAKRIWGNK